MDPANFNVDAKAMEHLEKRIAPAEYKIIDANMLKVCKIDWFYRFNIFYHFKQFQSCIDQEFSKNGFFVSKNSVFCDEFSYCVRTLMADIEIELSTGNAIEPDHRLKFVGLFCLIALHNRIFHTLDKRLLNKIWDLCKKVCKYF